jgi:hydroxymethylpyrimidine/phosphomethylpyrimidine kinase
MSDSNPRPSSRTPPMVLTFAAADPTGGAGLQADVLTLASMGCHPLSVVTALTVQDTSGVERLRAVEHEWVVEQARVLLAEMRVDAFKLGVLGSAQNAAVIAGILAEHPGVPVVLDPVLASGRGDPLASDDIIDALREMILPQATVVTPNSMEARRLASARDLPECARRILGMGADYVLITGSHESTADVVNTLYDAGGVVRKDRWQRLAGSYHGSGCTLASALAAALAHGKLLAEAVHDAQEFTWHALAAGFRPGKGQFLPNRSFRIDHK